MTGPLLSVVVPAYDVEEYLDATLANLAEQTYGSFEVVVVDDGSHDGTPAIVEAWSRRDERFRLVRQDNAGPSAARNTGIAHCAGSYLTFVDGDDLLPPEAWAGLVGSLERTGSDFSVGKIERDDGERRFATERMERNHAVLRERVRVEEMPEILADVFPVNKVYRREFWDRLGLRFPEGVFYEDQPVMTIGFLEGTFDVLPETVYWYAIRRDKTSTTQLRHQLSDLSDRMVTKRMTVASVQDHGSAAVSHTFFANVLPVDMWEYFRSVPGCSEEYWQLLHDGVNEFWTQETVTFDRTEVPVQQRLMGWLVSQGRREDLVDLLDWLDTSGRPTVQQDGVAVLDHRWRTEAGVPLGCLVP